MTFNQFDTCEPDEQTWLRSLSHKNPGLAEVVDTCGRRIASQPPYYNFSEEDLLFKLMNAKARVDAIEYEIERRVEEPERVVLEFIADRFKPALRRTYSNSNV